MRHWLSEVTPVSRFLSWVGGLLLAYQSGLFLWATMMAPPGWTLARLYRGSGVNAWWHWINVVSFVGGVTAWFLSEYWRTSFPRHGGIE